jgi:hypothetical protein
MRSPLIQSLVLFAAGVFGIVSGCSKNPVPQGAAGAPMGQQVAAQIGLGQLSGHTYTHEHFKLSVTIPEEWYIQKSSEADQLAKAGSTLIKEEARAAMDAAKQRTLNLVSAFKHPPGTPVPFNPNLIVMAENLAFLPGLKEGRDYLNLLQQSMANMTIKYEFDPVETGQKIGSLPAGRLQARAQIAGRNVNQEYYAARSGDYFLVVILTFSSDAERDALRTILTSMKAG